MNTLEQNNRRTVVIAASRERQKVHDGSEEGGAQAAIGRRRCGYAPGVWPGIAFIYVLQRSIYLDTQGAGS
jgi:hypothetical protein